MSEAMLKAQVEAHERKLAELRRRLELVRQAVEALIRTVDDGEYQ